MLNTRSNSNQAPNVNYLHDEWFFLMQEFFKDNYY